MQLCRSSAFGTSRVEVIDREPGIAPDRQALEPASARQIYPSKTMFRT
jgi:hypothetical protein